MAVMAGGVICVAAAGAATGIYLTNKSRDAAKDDDGPIPLLQVSASIQRAMSYATVAYRHQIMTNGTNEPYARHVVRVAVILSEAGINDHIPLLGAFLLGVGYARRATFEDVEEKFGTVVGSLVREITQARRNLTDLMAGARQTGFYSDLSPNAKLVILAREIDILRDLVDIRPPRWSDMDAINYAGCVRGVFEAIRGANKKMDDEMIHRLQMVERKYYAALARRFEGSE